MLDALGLPGRTALPAFDKAADERRPAAMWRAIVGPVDVVVFEGWCIGALPQPEADLVRPVNRLEAEHDPDAVWRTYANRQLAGPYQALFGRLDRLALLEAPGFEVVRTWRTEQEHKLRARTGRGMSDAEVAGFVDHYERLTRWILAEMPGRADMVFQLDAQRRPRAVRLPPGDPP